MTLMQVLISSGGPAIVGAWNPGDKTAEIVLSNSNLTMTHNGTGSVGSVRSTNSISTGLDYVEITILSTSTLYIGVGTSGASLVQVPGGNATSLSLNCSSGDAGNGKLLFNSVVQSSASGVGSLVGNGDVIGFKIDRTGGTLAVNKNNGTFGSAFALPAGAMFLFAGGFASSCQLNASPIYPIPTGYTYWGN